MGRSIMGMWGIILLVVCIMSAVMIIFGLLFSIQAPKKINYIFGYRTPMSMKNTDTWNFGNKCSGNCMWRTGIILLVGSLIALFIVMNGSAATIRNVGIIIIAVHAVMIFGSIIYTERSLRKNFDHEGNRKV